jgi:hypothetical protein
MDIIIKHGSEDGLPGKMWRTMGIMAAPVPAASAIFNKLVTWVVNAM